MDAAARAVTPDRGKAVIQRISHVTPDERTHPNRSGAELNAEFVIVGLKALPANPLEPYFSSKAAGVKP